jgi:transposase
MSSDSQPLLVEIPEQPPAEKRCPKQPQPRPSPKLKLIDRSQGSLRPLIVEELVPEDHKARAIWYLTGVMDLSGLYDEIVTRQGEPGSAAWDPRLLLSVWVYAYSEQISSARLIERMMAYEPGLMWLAGLGEVNHHTLSDFRARHRELLDQLLAELLGVLSREGIVKLQCVAHDGTKIRAQAGTDTFRREATLEKEIAKAKQVVEELSQVGEQEAEGERRRRAARERAARERAERLQQAAEELEKIRKGKDGEGEREQARVSLTEPEARIMKHGDNAIAPSYNVQISTDAERKIVVGVHVTQCSSDGRSLLPAMEQVQATVGKYPEQVIADGGFTNRQSIQEMNGKQIDFYGSLPDAEAKQAAAMKAAGIDPAFRPAAFVVMAEQKSLCCPAGKMLPYVRQSKKRDDTYHQYQANGADCVQCQFQKQCCPEKPSQGRTVSVRVSEAGEVTEFREKMKSEAAQSIYRRRGPVAEFPNCWIKEKLGIRKFRLRGLAKAATEAMWAVLTYNIMQWIRLIWKPKQVRSAAGMAAAVYGA